MNVLEPWETRYGQPDEMDGGQEIGMRMSFPGAKWSGTQASAIETRFSRARSGNPVLRWRQFELELTNDIDGSASESETDIETGPAIKLGLTWFVDMADIAGA